MNPTISTKKDLWIIWSPRQQFADIWDQTDTDFSGQICLILVHYTSLWKGPCKYTGSVSIITTCIVAGM